MYYEDAYLEGYYDAILESDYDDYEEDDYEDAYLEGYYDALLEQGNAVNRAKRRKFEIERTNNTLPIYDSNKMDKTTKAGEFWNTTNYYGDKEPVWKNAKTGKAQTLKFDIPTKAYYTAGKIARHRQLSRAENEFSKSKTLQRKLNDAKRQGKIHKGLSDPNNLAKYKKEAARQQKLRKKPGKGGIMDLV
jgi:hypothetical protein